MLIEYIYQNQTKSINSLILKFKDQITEINFIKFEKPTHTQLYSKNEYENIKYICDPTQYIIIPIQKITNSVTIVLITINNEKSNLVYELIKK